MKILFCDAGYSEARRRLALELPEHSIDAVAAGDVQKHLDGVDVLVPYMARIDAAVIDAGTFGLVQQFGVGLETVDVEAATRAGVWVARIPSGGTGNAESVAEHALLLMLALARKLPQAAAAMRDGRLGEPPGSALAGKTACIVGIGAAGAALAVRLAALNMRLIAVRKNLTGPLPANVAFARTFDVQHLADAVREADFLIITARYDASAKHLVDRRIFDAMKPGAYLVNVARGGFVDHEALADALRGGRLAGAGLDVIEGEPVAPTHPLLALNVIATPHVAGVTDLSYEGIAREVADNMRRYARGEAPRNAVNAIANPRRRG
ncbi:MAG TPA: NAD(P)-dependent oxidoreductase [Candidatus Eremiobacteraceae bacterium]|nr:NAD(P)-dependent oxidoreductase [Candidatus Eremiobacteraceae bacterium]